MTDPGFRSKFTLFRNATRSHSPRIAQHTVLATAADAYDPPPANKDDAALMARLFKAK